MSTGSRQIGLTRVPRALDRLVRLRPAQAWLLVLLCADLAAIGDLATGPDLWFGPVYLFVMCIATWTLGWRAGQSVGIACMAMTFALNGPGLYPYGGAQLAWNFTMRFTAMSFVIVVIAGVRRAYVREWWLARTDMLTGALNRQAFFELGGALAGSCTWRLLLYADLDGLKAINDGEGHAAGDACLRAYAAAVRKIIRREDMFARVGGDEFLLFMAVKNENAARALAARLHEAMNEVRTVAVGRLRCSLGALLVPPGRISMDDLVRRADALMYTAKQRGAGLELGTAANVEQTAADSGARRLPRPPASDFRPIRSRFADRRASGAIRARTR